MFIDIFDFDDNQITFHDQFKKKNRKLQDWQIFKGFKGNSKGFTTLSTTLFLISVLKAISKVTSIQQHAASKLISDMFFVSHGIATNSSTVSSIFNHLTKTFRTVSSPGVTDMSEYFWH